MFPEVHSDVLHRTKIQIILLNRDTTVLIIPQGFFPSEIEPWIKKMFSLIEPL